MVVIRQGLAAVSADQVLRQQLGMTPPGAPQIVQLGPKIQGSPNRVALIRGFSR